MYELLLRRIKHKNIFLFSFTFFVVIFSSLLSRSVDVCSAGILSITISLIPLVQIMSKIIEIEEYKEEKLSGNLISRHKDFFVNYFSIFFGAVFAYYVFYTFIDNSIFFQQEKAIEDIHRAFATGKYLSSDEMFAHILLNNLKVLVLSFLFSFLFGAGAIYIILWNASIIGVFLGQETIKYNGPLYIKYILYPLYKLLIILPHGILEFLAYFISALAGGILSVALIKPLKKNILERIIIDSILLFVISIVVLVVAAFVEAYL